MLPVLLVLCCVAAGVRLWDGRNERSATWWVLWLVPLATLAAFVGVVVFGSVARQREFGLVLMPATSVWLAIIGIAIAAAIRGQRARALGWVVVALSLSLVGGRGTAILAMRALEREMTIDWRDEPPFDAVVVLGGGSWAGVVAGQPELDFSGDRIMLGARLYHRGQARLLVTTGSSATRTRDCSRETEQIWNDLGIPSDDILRVPEPVNTQQEIAAVARLRDENGWRRIGLVTSAWHMPRALEFCRREGLDVMPLPADHHAFGDHVSTMAATYLLPRGKGFADLELASWEFVGRIAR
jgi:uncharacterized SAM-binding protein YcdF (DUF218 family)